MRSTLLVAFSLFVIISDVAAQQMDWVRPVGDATGHTLVTGMRRHVGGGLVIGGSFTARQLHLVTPALVNVGQGDGFIAALQADGTARWARALGGTADDAVQAVAVDGSGAVYVGLRFNSLSLNVGGTTLFNRGEADAVLVKFSEQGSIERHWQLGSAGDDEIVSIAVDADGNVLLAAQSTDNQGPRICTLHVVKLTADFAPLWQRRGTSTDASVRGLAVDDNGNCFIAGGAWNNLLFDDEHELDLKQERRAFIAAYSSNGTWIQGKVDTNFTAINRLCLHEGTLYAAGEYLNHYMGWGWPLADSRILLKAMSMTLEDRWLRAAGGAVVSQSLDIVRDMDIDAQGTIFLTGDFFSPALGFAGDSLRNEFNKDYFYQQLFVLSYDRHGNELRGYSFAGNLNDAGSAIVALDGRRFVLAGNFESDALHIGGQSLINTATTREIYVHLRPKRLGRDAISFVAQFVRGDSGVNPPPRPEALRMYPNPSHGDVIVSHGMPYGQRYEVAVHDIAGRLHHRSIGYASSGSIRIPAGILAPGTYMVTVTSPTNSITGSFIRE
ncbi:MAG TPA: T9SS type A sorting domain-containing protein [Bacteroidota bacterium]|nr:T9SS type A sorting domain-containing protein [Bacteroidota bacterium]